MARADVLLVSLGSTAGLRAADAELAGVARARRRARRSWPPRGRRARCARSRSPTSAGRAPRGPPRGAGIAEHAPRAIALLDDDRRAAVAARRARSATTPRRRPTARAATASGSARSSAAACAQAPLLVPWARGLAGRDARAARARARRPDPRRAVAARRPAARDIAAITYAANPHKKGLDRVLAAWTAARREGEELVVAGTEHVPARARRAHRRAPAARRLPRAAAPRARVRHRARAARTTGSPSSRRWPTAACS